MLFAATTINYIDRQVLGVLAPDLGRTIGWTELQYSYIIAAFQGAYAIGLVCAGAVIDRLGTRFGYALAICIWSLAAAGHALARTPFQFGIARFFLEFVRGDEGRGQLFGTWMTQTQGIAIAMVIAGTIIWMRRVPLARPAELAPAR